jgi:hypothetical protein
MIVLGRRESSFSLSLDDLECKNYKLSSIKFKFFRFPFLQAVILREDYKKQD